MAPIPARRECRPGSDGERVTPVRHCRCAGQEPGQGLKVREQLQGNRGAVGERRYQREPVPLPGPCAVLVQGWREHEAQHFYLVKVY